MIRSIQEFRRAFEQRRPDGVQNLCGRVLRGKVPGDFETLTDDPTRKIVMLMDETGLESVLKCENGWEVLVTIGYEPDYAKHKVQGGFTFKIVVFPAEGGAAKLATWDGMLAVVADAYPELASDVRKHSAALKTLSFGEIEHIAKFNFLAVEKVGNSDPRFMTYERYLKSRRSLADFRALLYFTIHLRELFAGDGYTRDSQGRKGVKEYALANKPLTALGAHELIDFAVMLP